MKYIRKEEIIKGWSSDKKYCIYDEEGNKYLLRISDISKYEKKANEYKRMQEVAALGIRMCLPLEFGICDEGVYSIQSWIEGMDGEEYIDRLSVEKQYSYGKEAGQMLKKIHTIKAPDDVEDWEIRFNKKIDKRLKAYNDFSIKYENGECLVKYIEENRCLLKNRPQVYQHGDYHIGNMMFDYNGKLFIIDFDRDDYGDPWEEFNRIVWSAQKCPAFARGLVDGYFENNIPDLFWKLLALYIACNTLYSVIWAKDFGDNEIQTMLKQANDVLKWYDNMSKIIPSWYKD